MIRFRHKKCVYYTYLDTIIFTYLQSEHENYLVMKFDEHFIPVRLYLMFSLSSVTDMLSILQYLQSDIIYETKYLPTYVPNHNRF